MDATASAPAPAPAREARPGGDSTSVPASGRNPPRVGAAGYAGGRSLGPPAPAARETASDWAICCSGGGIRSATYSLGGLQSLQEGGVLGRAKWILGVSGGSYIAASRALVAHGLRRGGDGRPAYARGTPEEQNLRNNTHYIAPDAKTVLVAVLSLLLGAAVTAILVLAPVYALSHAWGWLLRGRGVLAWSGGHASASVTGWTWWLTPAIAAAVTMALFVRWWATLGTGGARPRGPAGPLGGLGRGRHGRPGATHAGRAAADRLAGPQHRGAGHDRAVLRFRAESGSGSPATFAGLVAAVTAVAGYSRKGLAAGRLPAAAAGSSAGAAAKLSAWVRSKLTPWLASLVIVAAGAFATLLWIGTAARSGYSLGQLVPVLVALAVMLATRAVADINRTSLHDFYRWRLADAFAVTREAIAAPPGAREELFATAARTRLTELSGDRDEPALVIATTANINAAREAPPGRGGICLAFDPDKVTLRGDPRAGEPEVEVDTADYEHLLGHTRFTLFDVVAISGAAFSPLMGAATRRRLPDLVHADEHAPGHLDAPPEVVRRGRGST